MPRWAWLALAAVAVSVLLSVTLSWLIGLAWLLVPASAAAMVHIQSRSDVVDRLGDAAEQRTARLLRRLDDSEHRVLHRRNVPDTGVGVDHLVIGPSGVYAVGSRKWHSKIPVRVIGQDLFHGPFSQQPTLDAATRGAERVARLLSGELGQRVNVVPAVVVHGPDIPWKVLKVRGVDVLSARRLCRYIRDGGGRSASVHDGGRLSAVEVERISALARRLLPPR